MLTVITDDGTREVEGPHVSPEVLHELTGWELQPQGLCRGDVCVPTRSRADLNVDGAIDLAVVAELLGQPFVVDDTHAVAVLGTSVAARTQQLSDANIHDLVLRGFDGKDVAWSTIGRKKKVFVAWASW
jgi:hypothetical protein